MGDVLHTLPAVQDATLQLPGIQFDWIVEEAFQNIPYWHPAVKTVIPIALRRWRKKPLLSWSSGEPQAFVRQLRAQSYDLIIDAQGLLKSAWITRLAKGPRVGFDQKSAREPIATWAYQKKIAVPRSLHAITRLRYLFAKALNYPMPESTLQYGLSIQPADWFFEKSPYLVFLSATTWDSKHWPENYWQTLIQQANKAGFQVLLPWGSSQEQQRAERLAPFGAIVLPKLTINEIAYLLQQARGCVAVDTGLGHIATAVGTPTVSLYGPTDPQLTGALGPWSRYLIAQKECVPCLQKTCRFKALPIMPPCFITISPEQVWDTLSTLLAQKEQQT